MADRYATAVKDLIGSLDDPSHRDESAKILRELIEKIVLTPNEAKTALIVDLYGDLAGILQISQASGNRIELKQKGELDKPQLTAIQQVQDLVRSSATEALQGFEPRQDVLVAGATGGHTLTRGKGEVVLVAGVGFEPTTFRL